LSKMQSRQSVTVQDYTALTRVFVVASERARAEQLRTELGQRGFDCLLVSSKDAAIEQIAGQSAGIVLLDMRGVSGTSTIWELARNFKQETKIPVIALVSREELDDFHSAHGVDDFVVKPWDIAEVMARIKRVLRQKGTLEGEDMIRCGDLVVDLAKCEVSLGAKLVTLTFKEYQLLKFLASNSGRVFTREALVNRVWGWDYYGGDRTVDVHIRRLRSKIEDMDHSFIETIRNIGYRFTDQ
jgi:two-component system alkaline phosphatase synthesis response regulator PhoP